MQVKKVQKKKKYRRVESGFSKYRNEIMGLVLFALGVLSLCSFLLTSSMGVFGKAITDLLQGFLGGTSYVVPFVLIVYGSAMIFKKNSHTFHMKLLFLGILMVLISAFLQVAVFNPDEYTGKGFLSSCAKFYTDGTHLVGGGLLGGLLSMPFLMAFQVLGTIIILITISIIDIILLTSFSLAAVMRGIYGYTSDKIKTSNENRKIKKAERQRLEEEDIDGELDSIIEEEEEKPGKKKIINFKIERENRANKAAKKLSTEEDQNTSAAPAAEANGPSIQKESEDDFRVTLQGFNDVADKLVISDMKTEVMEKGFAESAASAEKTSPEKAVKEEPVEELIIPEPQPPKPLIYNFPSPDLLNQGKDDSSDMKALKNTAMEGAKKLEDTLKSFGVEARVINISRGPAVTRYELQPSPGVKVSKIVNLSDDIALNLAAAGVRIEAPIPGKAAVGIEVPNKLRFLIVK